MISVVVPAYNAVGTLGACLRALNQQTAARDQYEIIVVDDGSTDATAARAQEAGADQVLSCPHRGPAMARNAGLAAAKGEVILFTDADCQPAPDWLAEMTRAFSDLHIAGVKGSYRTHQQEAVARLAQCEFEERYNRLQCLPFIDFVDSYAAAFRASVLRQVGGFDPAFPHANNEDVDLSYRLAQLGHKLVFNRKAVVYHRHPSRWSKYFRLKVKRGYWRMVVYRLYPGKALRDSYTPQLMKAQVGLALLTAVLAGGTILWPLLAWGVGLAFVCLLVSTVPFTRLVARHDSQIALLAPLFVVVRAMAFALGVASGLVGMWFFHPDRATDVKFGA